MWPFTRSETDENADRISRDVALAFKHGQIISEGLDGHGISSLTVRWNGRYVTAQWLGWTTTKIQIGNSSAFPSGRYANRIVKAARRRAAGLTAQYLQHLAAEVGASQPLTEGDQGGHDASPTEP